MKFKFIFFLMFILIVQPKISIAAEVSFTFDDFNIDDAVMFPAEDRNKKILETLDQYSIKATLFVQGVYVDSARGKSLLSEWNDKGHQIGNHTYSHLNYHSPNVNFEEFIQDLLKAENLLKYSSHFQKLFRFPYLHEGNTQDKINQIRNFLKKHEYQVGHVTIDASDWYINDRMIERFKKNSKANLNGYRDYFLNHIWERANFYNNLSKQVLGREVKHNVLLHYNLLNTLFLKDLISMFQKKNWKIISSVDAFQDPIYKKEPQIVPSGNSIIWALAKESGKYDAVLRDPGEDSSYEQDLMGQAGL